MVRRFKRDDVLDFPPEDEMGFAVPVSPSHSLKLLNSYMRTDLLRPLHQHLHRMKDTQEPGSPLNYLAKSLELVIGHFEGGNLFECVNRNPFYIDPGYEFDAEKDYLHDIKLMKHHLKCHKKTIKAIGRD
jgi:hypothetical protein